MQHMHQGAARQLGAPKRIHELEGQASSRYGGLACGIQAEPHLHFSQRLGPNTRQELTGGAGTRMLAL